MGKSDSGGLVAFIKKHDSSIIQLSLVLIMSIPLIQPLGLPITVSNHPKTFYSYIDSMDSDTKVIIDFSVLASSMGEVTGSAIAVIDHMMNRGVQLYFIGLGPEPDGVTLILDKYIWPAIQPEESYGYIYGENYVNLGYVPGTNVAYSTFAADPKSTTPFDYYGTPVGSIPMMDDINDLNDFDWVMLIGEYHQTMVNQWTVPYNMPHLSVGYAMQLSRDLEPFYQTGVITEYLAGSIHGAEYEQLIGKPGRGLATVDSLSLSHLLMLGFFAVANGYMLLNRGGKEK